MRNVPLVTGEIYHIFNRGVDKRAIFYSKRDLVRFYEAIQNLNTVAQVGHLSRRFPESTEKGEDPLVKILAYNLNSNHFHFILEQTAERGIEKFINRICISHSKYFNIKYNRAGTLFQGRFKSIHVDSNEYLLHLSAYVNLNDVAHARGSKTNLSLSSWGEYVNGEKGICDKAIVLEQFKNVNKYKRFAESTLKDIIARKILIAEIDDDLLSIPGIDEKKR